MIRRVLLSIGTAFVCASLAILVVEQMPGRDDLAGQESGGLYDTLLPAQPLREEIRQGLRYSPPLVNQAHVRALAIAAPLDPLSFTALLPDSVAAWDSNRTEALTGHILRRSPRDRSAWRAKLYMAAHEEKTDEMIEALSRLYILDADTRPQYIDALTEIGLSASGRAVFLDAVEHQPSWARAAIQHILDASDDDEFLLALVSAYPEYQSRYLQKLTEKGDWPGAYIAFLSLLPPEARLDIGSPFDSEFSGSSAPRPFNWLLNADYTYREPRGGLSAAFPGNSRTWLARQAVALSPGEYVLSASMSGRTTTDGGYFRWEISCIEGGSLAYLNTRDLLPVKQSYVKHFTIPSDANCTFQDLKFFGMGGAFPRRAHATIYKVSIVSVPEHSQ